MLKLKYLHRPMNNISDVLEGSRKKETTPPEEYHESKTNVDFVQQESIEEESLKGQPFFRRIVDSFKRSEGEEKELSKELGNFQVQMIALGGCVGSGLLIGSSEALSKGGPGSLMICFPLVSTMVWMMSQAAAELAVILPVPGGFSSYASRFVDNSWGFAMGVNYAMQWLILLPLELAAATMAFKFWPQVQIPDFILISIFFLAIIIINMLSVKVYGWCEVAFSLCKVVAILVFIIVAIYLTAGGSKEMGYIGARYWQDPGAFNNGFKGVSNTFLVAAFSFSGTELTALAACETKDVRKQIPKATKQIFWRILFIYLTCLILIGFLVPYNDPNLLGVSGTNANASPFVLAMRRGGLEVFASLMNVVILISILSLSNSLIYASSRTLVFLASSGLVLKGKWLNLAFIDRKGRPIVANIFTLLFGLLAYITCFSPKGAQLLFTWLLALSGLSSLFTWGTISVSHICFRKALKLQNRTLDELPFKATLGVTGSYYGLMINIIILGIQFWLAVAPIGEAASAEAFFKKYSAFPFVLISFFGHKLFVRFKHGNWGFDKSFATMDLDSGRREHDRAALVKSVAADEAEFRAKPWFVRIYKIWC